MKILLEINPLALQHKSGVPYFIEALCEALLRQLERSPGDEMTLWAPNLERDPFPQFARKRFFRGGLPRDVREVLWTRLAWGGVPPDIDIYHLPFLATPAPRPQKSRFVATIYDLAFMHFPDIAPSPEVFRGQVECTLRQALESDHILTISKATKRDIIAAFGVAGQKISVIYPGTHIEAPRAHDEAGRAAFAALNLPERFVLCVGTWEPRKNLPLLLRAWAKLRPPGVALALCGAKGWKFQNAEALVDELQLHDSVLPLGYVPREAMPHLYAKAQFMVFPSLYEGFGLPALEAMTCGCPVLCSNTSSLPEVVGDAALMVSPRDKDELAEAIKRLLSDADLRDDLRRRGLAQARRFSWETAARQTLDVYKSLSAGR